MNILNVHYNFYSLRSQLYFINFGCGRAFHFGSIALCELQFTFLRTPCTTYAFIFFHYHIARHKKCFNFNALYQRFATTYATFQHNSNGLFFLNATSWSKDYISTKWIVRFLLSEKWVPSRPGKPENNAQKITHDFYACLFFGGSIKVITDFLIGSSDTISFFSPDTTGPGIHSKKCVVVGFNNVEK